MAHRRQAARGVQPHVQQKQAQHAFEQVPRKRLHCGLALVARHQANHHRTQKQQLRAIGKRLVKDLAHRKVWGWRCRCDRTAMAHAVTARRTCARRGHRHHRLPAVCGHHAGRCRGLTLAQRIGQHHRQNNRGRLHQCHGGRHVAAVGNVLRIQVLRGRHKRHRTHRPVRGRHRRGVKARNHPPQQHVAHQRHYHRQQHRKAQAAGHAGREPRCRQRKTALEPQRHQQVDRQELGDCCRHLQVRSDQARKHPQGKKQDRRVQQALHQITPCGVGC